MKLQFKVLLLLAPFFVVSDCFGISPDVASKLTGIPALEAEPYRFDGLSWIGSSDYFHIGSKSNIAYYIEGTSSDVSKMKLVCSIYKPSNGFLETGALKSVVENMLRSLKLDFPEALLADISNSNPSSYQLNTWEVKIVAFDWSSGRGRDVKVIFYTSK